jgi:MYXO-CTERM domain-containing protein
MGGGPFSSTSTTATGGAGRSNVPAVVFGVAWLGLLAAGMSFLWRRTRRHLPAASPTA